MKILLITPPLLQPNTPYPATPLLTAWLRSQGHDAVQADLSLECLLALFSKEGLSAVFKAFRLRQRAPARHVEPSDIPADDYLETIESVVAFLQGKAPELAEELSERGALPEGPHLFRAYEQDEQFGWNFRGVSTEDRARHLCSLYLDDIAEAVKMLDPNFGFSRYAEDLSVSLPRFGKLREVLEASDSLFFQTLEKLTDQALAKHQPELVAITVPFPGCLLGALAIARRIRHSCLTVKIMLGGGYVNTELRELSDPSIFDFVDFVSLDSGMIPLLRIANGETPVRTFVCEDNQTHPALRAPLRGGDLCGLEDPLLGGVREAGGGSVLFYPDAGAPVPHNDLPPPVFDGLPMDSYFGLFEVLNPVTRLWSDGRWNKLVLAHGCCWSRCAFCDTSVDYICRYDPAAPTTICDWMESMISESGFNGFHFVDEALPPDLLDRLCDEILARGLSVEWWGNIRFENRFSGALIEKMAASGCIAVTGGLETCCDRTLKLMRKGITVASASGVLGRLADAGILTHAYLMYGFPTQTQDETFQALETVRSLVDAGALHSAYWHRFALTAHSEISRDPERFSIRLLEEPATDFARNEIPFDGGFDYDLDAVGTALRTATYNYQHGAGLDLSIDHWCSDTFGN